MSKESIILLLFIMVLFIIGGCQTQELNESGVVAGLGIDLEEEELQVSMQMARPALPGQSSGSEPAFEVVSAKGRSLSEGLRKITLLFPRNPLVAQANLLVIGEELAKTDLALIADSILRNPSIRKNAVVVVAREVSPKDVLNTQVAMESLSATAIPRMLRNQERQMGIYQEVSLEEFLNKLARPGVDPTAPAVTLIDSINGKAIRLEGTAVFKGREMAGYLDSRESRGLRFLNPGRIQGGLINIPAPFEGPGRVGIEIIRSQTKVEAANTDGQIVMRITYIGEGNYYEQTGEADILRLENIPVLESICAEQIKSDMQACIKQAQKLKSDIFGWGNIVYSQHPAVWAELGPDWEEIFPGVKTEIKVEFELRRTYVTDQSLHYQ
ncbi:MAG: Ger(x)C family spore germination protein [Syntrophomonadaceae bacterium]|nr:Ger(x)C family spore germination protein [Syntrophomonadaceae bacterium]